MAIKSKLTKQPPTKLLGTKGNRGCKEDEIREIKTSFGELNSTNV